MSFNLKCFGVLVLLAITTVAAMPVEEPLEDELTSGTQTELETSTEWGGSRRRRTWIHKVVNVFNPPPSPVHCAQSEWHCLECSVTCDYGTQTCHRSTTREPQHGGNACGPSQKTQPCLNHHCPTPNPTAAPSRTPTEHPTTIAPSTNEPSGAPTGTPTELPSGSPIPDPTHTPTVAPTAVPSYAAETLATMATMQSEAQSARAAAFDKYTELAATANEMIKFDATEAVSAQPDMSEIDACDLAIKGCGYLPEYVTETFRALPMISCQTAEKRCRAAAEKYDGLLKTASQKFQSLAGTSEAA